MKDPNSKSIKVAGAFAALSMLFAACGGAAAPRGAARTAVGAGEGQVNIVAWAGYIERGETDKNL